MFIAFGKKPVAWHTAEEEFSRNTETSGGTFGGRAHEEKNEKLYS